MLPLIPLAIIVGTALTGSGGAAAGIWGGAQIKQAKADMALDSARYERRYRLHVSRVSDANTAFQRLERTKEWAQLEIVRRMTEFLERNAKQVRVHDRLILDGMDEADREIVGLAKLDSDLAGWVRGVVSSALLGVATPAVIRMGVMSLATAGTGSAIAGLSGAAATSATMAWLGGGALAAGGGGMALGAAVLNVAVVGPTVLIAGVTVKNRGAKAVTEAEKHRVDVDVAVAQLNTRDELMRAVRMRADEVQEVLRHVGAHAFQALDVLESEPFVMQLHAERLQDALILVKAVHDIVKAPIADEDQNLDPRTQELVIKYRTQRQEKVDA